MKFSIEIDPSNPADVAIARDMLDRMARATAGESQPPPPVAAAAPPATAPAPPPAAAPAPATDPAIPSAQQAFGAPGSVPPPPSAVPPPPAAGPAPAPQVTAPETPPPPAQELDAAGYPWNPVLHAASKRKLKDGTWSRKRGVSQEAVVAFFTAQGTANAGTPPTPAAGPAPATGPAAAPPPPPPAPIPAQTSSVAAPPPPGTQITWDAMMAAVTQRSIAYDTDAVQNALSQEGLDLLALHQHSEQWPAAIVALEKHCPLPRPAA